MRDRDRGFRWVLGRMAVGRGYLLAEARRWEGRWAVWLLQGLVMGSRRVLMALPLDSLLPAAGCCQGQWTPLRCTDAAGTDCQRRRRGQEKQAFNVCVSEVCARLPVLSAQP